MSAFFVASGMKGMLQAEEAVKRLAQTLWMDGMIVHREDSTLNEYSEMRDALKKAYKNN